MLLYEGFYCVISIMAIKIVAIYKIAGNIFV